MGEIISPHATEADDSIAQFAQCRQTQSNHVALGSWDYKALVATSADEDMDEVPPSVPRLETYEGAGACLSSSNTTAMFLEPAEETKSSVPGEPVTGWSSSTTTVQSVSASGAAIALPAD